MGEFWEALFLDPGQVKVVWDALGSTLGGSGGASGERVWQGGPVLQLMTPDPGNPGNQGIVPNHRFYQAKVLFFIENMRGERVWQGGLVLQLMTPDPGNPGNQGIVQTIGFINQKCYFS